MSGSSDRDPLLSVIGLSKVFPVPLGWFRIAHLHAIRDVSVDLNRGRTLAIVGESGCGKTTLGRLVLRLIEPTAGSIRLDGTELTTLSGSQLRAERAKMQMVFQDPLDSLSPWQTVEQTIREPLELHERVTATAAHERVSAILRRVGLSPAHAKRYPHQLSGGQQQRVGIARAVVTNPSLVVLDEPTSSLDMSVQAQILQLLQSLQRERKLSYLFISHNLSIVRFIAHEVAVMYLGRVVERGEAPRIFDRPAHPYTQALLAASPRPVSHRKAERTRLMGEQPSPIGLLPGCPLYGRCPIALPVCERLPQQLVELEPRHQVACWRVAPPSDLQPALRSDILGSARAADYASGASVRTPPTPSPSSGSNHS
jgi:oligopeptide/dipeptide ABC transporter ATP-binding protein